VGNIGDRTLATLSWTDVATALDGGVVVDTGYDPRQGLLFDAGTPDAGPPDAGDGGGGGNPGGGGGPVGPGIPVESGTSSCAAAGGMPTLLPLVAALALAMLLRRRRSG